MAFVVTCEYRERSERGERGTCSEYSERGERGTCSEYSERGELSVVRVVSTVSAVS